MFYTDLASTLLIRIILSLQIVIRFEHSMFFFWSGNKNLALPFCSEENALYCGPMKIYQCKCKIHFVLQCSIKIHLKKAQELNPKFTERMHQSYFLLRLPALTGKKGKKDFFPLYKR